ncbi:CP4-6 prophage; ABC transporter ATP-binding protein AfuC [Rhodovastum atsumiense]|uniref:ABC transporter ATP-binding protein n=1 Tax=Rhodovastum atsumiense TaxID=504468 RepID=A0A5M6J0R7_9PROT|nr:ABC transporter ATP-binding protein [Rhodovastum atsumiense]KAA5614101.1 ABC transporter ATP-binding protein [Rhodovastum atsumiense]CAH2598942.1 CP4-6 prophage; ABC transporter ATP-binding protein AfuC [Rhodovastum atsumiense]
MTAALSLRSLGKRYGLASAVEDVTLDIEPGEMVVLLGPSGCGKTTTLRMIAGFVEASGGDILLDGHSIRRLPPHRREMGMVFQSYALFPHLSVARNVAFGLEMRGVPRAEREAQVAGMLRLVKLDALAARLPRELSGGQQQRVAIARALAIRPRLLLLDEPLSNLDAALRQDVAREMRLLQRARGLTAIMVTHDQTEAMAMADRLVVMRAGRVEQIGTQEDLYERPATPFVAGFIGHSNLLPGTLHEGHVLQVPGSSITLAQSYGLVGNATLAVRPERIVLAPPGTHPDERALGRVELSTYLGAVVEHVVRLGPETQVVVTGASSGAGAAHRFPAGMAVALCWTADSERLFNAAGGAVHGPRVAAGLPAQEAGQLVGNV